VILPSPLRCNGINEIEGLFIAPPAFYGQYLPALD
jgi:hypothetical protein